MVIRNALEEIRWVKFASFAVGIELTQDGRSGTSCWRCCDYLCTREG